MTAEPRSPSTVSRDHVLPDVIQIVAEHFVVPAERIDAETDLVRDLGADSLDVIEIAMEVEEQFDITAPDDMGESARTVGAIADGVSQLLAVHETT